LNAQQYAHFFIEESFAGKVRLHPPAVDHELRNRAFADVLQEFIGSPRGTFDIDFLKGNVVLFQKILGFAAIAAPKGGIDGQIH